MAGRSPGRSRGSSFPSFIGGERRLHLRIDLRVLETRTAISHPTPQSRAEAAVSASANRPAPGGEEVRRKPDQRQRDDRFPHPQLDGGLVRAVLHLPAHPLPQRSGIADQMSVRVELREWGAGPGFPSSVARQVPPLRAFLTLRGRPEHRKSGWSGEFELPPDQQPSGTPHAGKRQRQPSAWPRSASDVVHDQHAPTRDVGPGSELRSGLALGGLALARQICAGPNLKRRRNARPKARLLGHRGRAARRGRSPRSSTLGRGRRPRHDIGARCGAEAVPRLVAVAEPRHPGPGVAVLPRATSSRAKPSCRRTPPRAGQGQAVSPSPAPVATSRAVPRRCGSAAAARRARPGEQRLGECSGTCPELQNALGHQPRLLRSTNAPTRTAFSTLATRSTAVVPPSLSRCEG